MPPTPRHTDLSKLLRELEADAPTANSSRGHVPASDRDFLAGLLSRLLDERTAAAHLPKRLDELQAKLADTHDELDWLRREVSALREYKIASRTAIRNLQRENRELTEKLDTVRDLVGPSESFLCLPLCFKSENGEFLGVATGGSKHFALRDFLDLIHTRAGTSHAIARQWVRQKPDCAETEHAWRLAITEHIGTPHPRTHTIHVARQTTPRGNTVVLLQHLTFNGQPASTFLFYELFKELGKGFGEAGR